MGERAECHHCHGSFIFNDQVTYNGAPLEPPMFHNTGLYNLGGTGAFPEPNRGVFELTGVREGHGRVQGAVAAQRRASPRRTCTTARSRRWRPPSTTTPRAAA